MGKFVVLTDRRYAGDGSLSDMPPTYVANVLEEDRLVVESLQRLGIPTIRRAWCDRSVSWEQAQGALFRTTWDYFDRWPEFSAWLSETAKKTPLFNAPELVNWNLDKHYLGELEEHGVDVVPTAFVDRHQKGLLREFAQLWGWNDVVIKPAVAGAARDTYRVNFQGDRPKLSPEPVGGVECEPLWAALVSKQDMLVQPFLSDIETAGEHSVVWLDGKVTHAVRKCAKSGDFRVQDDHGGTVRRTELSEELSQTALGIMEKTLALCAVKGWAPPLYARVDLMRGAQGNLLLSELEMVEPELWFRFSPEAADTLAEAIKIRLLS